MIDIEKVKQELQKYISEYGMDYYASSHFHLTSEAITELERLQKREMPYKPQMTDSGYYACKCTQRMYLVGYNYCPQCGQKLDWSVL